MGQITKSLASVCQSVCRQSYNRNFDSVLIKFCTAIRDPKSKISFVWNKNLITPSPILPKFKKIALRPMGISKRCNSVPVKDNCALRLPTLYFRGWAI